MPRYFTCHWQNRSWCSDVNDEYAPLRCAGGNTFRQKGVSAGDTVYVISLALGQVYLGAKMTVQRIVSRSEAMRILRSENLYEPADEWIIAKKGSGTPLNLSRRLAPEVTRLLRFGKDDSTARGLRFDSKTRLNVQTTRGIREIRPASAAVLDRIIAITDPYPRGKDIIVTLGALNQSSDDHGTSEETQLNELEPKGAGYGDPERNREVERAAVSFVRGWYAERGWSVKSVERNRCGYDLICRRNLKEEHVEVKGVSGREQDFIITGGEVHQAQTNRDFRVCVVTNALSATPIMSRCSGSRFLSRFSLEPVQYRAVLR